jgi:acetylornithine/succinyldiaminopimelate/putrescine aminotransferase
MTDIDWVTPSDFERFVNPVTGELMRRLGVDKRFVRGDGCWLYTERGEPVLDFLAAYGALPFGHSPADMLEVLCNMRHSQEPVFVQPAALGAAAELAQRLLALLPGRFESVTFQNSGAEAVEAALKACIAATGRTRVLSMAMGFHGKTLGALSATANPIYQRPFGAPMPGFDWVAFGDSEAAESALRQHPGEYAAVIVEPIQGEGGIHPAPRSYLAELRRLCDAHGTLLVLDEVQTGLGRTGRLFAAAADPEVRPDVLVLAKALGGGVMPVAACLLGTRAQSREFHLRHSSTFGGNTLACRVGIAALKRIVADGAALVDQVARNGAHLLQRLHTIAQTYPSVIREVRGEGFLIGVEFEFDRSRMPAGRGSFLGVLGEQATLVPLIASHLLNAGGVRVAPTLNGANTLRVEPPLVASRAECDFFLNAFEETVKHVAAGDSASLLAPLIGTPDSQRIDPVAEIEAQPASTMP